MWLALLGFLKPFWNVLKSIPWRAWVGFVAFLVGVLLVFAYGNYREDKGASRVQGYWDASTAQYEDALRKEKERQSKVEIQTVTEYVYRDREIRVKGDTIIQKVPVYVPVDSPDLPGGWRLLHDAAARNVLPEAPGSVQAFPVSAQDAARTVVSNYTSCHAELEKLNGLWNWANGVSGSVEVSRNGL